MNSVAFFNVAHNLGGAEISLIELCRYLQMDISVICPEGSILEARIKQQRIHAGPIRVPVLRGGSGMFAKLTNYTYALKTRVELEHLFANHTWDLFVANNLMADFFAGDIPSQHCRKTVSYCRDNPVGDVKAKFLPTRDLVIAPSAWIAEKLKKSGVEKVVQISNGIDAAYFEAPIDRAQARHDLNLPEGPRIVGYACQFIRRKGLTTFIACAERLATRDKGIHFAIAGGDLYEGSPFVQEIKSRIAASPARERISMTGCLEDMRPFYAALDLYVSLSRDEPFGRTPLEAALCGTIPVASREGGYLETLGDFPELLVSPTNISEICSCIEDFLSPRGRKEKILENIRTHAKTYSAETTAAKLQQELEKLLA